MDIRPFINAFLVHLYFSKINNLYLEELPRNKPILFVNLHRNGACDGWVYQNSFLRNRRFPTFTLSSQLTRHFVGRMFFRGIEFMRKKDGGNREKNAQALESCVQHLRNKKDLVIFPEGSSDLRCKPLPFHKGFAKIIEGYLEKEEEIAVVPVGVEYVEPTLMGSKVTVIYGKKLVFRKGNDVFTEVEKALLSLSFVTESEEEQEERRALANFANYESGVTYYDTLKVFERSVDFAWISRFRDYRQKTAKLSLESGLAFYPLHWWQHYPLIYTPIIFCGFLANFPCLLVSNYVGKRFSDDDNVVSFWKILSGSCLFYLYIVLVTVGTLFVGVKFTLGYFVLTYLYFVVYGTWRRAVKRLFNCIRGRRYLREFRELHKEVVDAVTR